MHQQTDQPARILSPVDSLHHSFATACARSLSAHAANSFRATPLAPAQLPYHDHLLTLANPTFLLVFTSNLFQGQLTLEFHPALAYLILEHLLGGIDPDPFIPKRKFTEIESRLLSPIINELLENLANAWPPPSSILYPPSSPPAFTLLRLEHNPHATHIVPDTERVTILPIEFFVKSPHPSHGPRTTDHGQFRLTLCLPTPALATLGPDESSPPTTGPSGHFHRHTPIEFRAILAETTLTLEDLATLQPGDILTTDRPANAPITLVPADREDAERLSRSHHSPHPSTLQGHLVKLRGQKALRITHASSALTRS